MTLKDSHVGVSKASQISGTGQSGRSGPNQGDTLVWIPSLKFGLYTRRHTHVGKALHGKLLQTGNVDRSTLGVGEIAASSTELRSHAEVGARGSDGILIENHLRRAVKVARLNAGDKGLDVNVGRTAFLTRRIGTLEAARCLFYSFFFGHVRMNRQAKVILQFMWQGILLLVPLELCAQLFRFLGGAQHRLGQPRVERIFGLEEIFNIGRRRRHGGRCMYGTTTMDLVRVCLWLCQISDKQSWRRFSFSVRVRIALTRASNCNECRMRTMARTSAESHGPKGSEVILMLPQSTRTI